MRQQLKKLTYILVFMLGLMCASAQEITDRLTEYINNGQLVIYSESSYLSDNSASAITYVDFCPGGIYHYSYDGSYTVKGTQNTSNRNNRAYGAGVAENSGQWKVLEYQGAHYLEILDAYGKTNYYPINIQNLANGKWKINNVTYVFAQGKGRCR